MATSDSNPNPPQDPLEEILKSARWPEPTGMERNRLEAQWESLALARFQSRRQLMRWTLAASILLAFGLGVGGWVILGPNPPKVASNVTPPQLADGPAPKPQEPQFAESLVWTPTRYEAVAFQMAVKRHHRVHRSPQLEPLVNAFNTLLEEPESNAAELCLPLKDQKAIYERLILSRIGQWNRTAQLAGVKVLMEIGSPQAIPVLDSLSRDPEFAKHAWPVALHLAPVKVLSEWAKTGTAGQRKQAMQKLLSLKEDPNGLNTMLHLVAIPDTRELAVSIITAAPNPPIEQLFVYLKHGTKEERHTAGLVLGQLKNPKITKELLAIARQQSFPPEVMLGLLNSSDRDAAKFLKQAKHNPSARTAVQLACLEWELISYTSLFPHPLEIH